MKIGETMKFIFDFSTESLENRLQYGVEKKFMFLSKTLKKENNLWYRNLEKTHSYEYSYE